MDHHRRSLLALLTLMLIQSALQGSIGAGEVVSGSTAYLDAKNGFRDMAFGSAPTAGMALMEDGGDNKYYTRTNESLMIGAAQIHRITYGYYKNRLSSIRIEVKGFINSQAVLDVLRQAYGAGYKSNRYLEEYLWRGSRVILSYDQNSITKDSIVWFFSVPLIDEEKTEKKGKAKKGVGDL